MTAWQLFAISGISFGAGVALGWIIGHAVGFYLGRHFERKRIARLIANKTALEVVTQLINTGTIKDPEKKKAKPRQVWPPRDETRH